MSLQVFSDTRLQRKSLKSIRVNAVHRNEDFLIPENREYFEYWLSLNNGRCPYRHQFDLLLNKHRLADLFVIHVRRDKEEHCVFTLIGDNIVDLLGTNEMGLELRETGWDRPVDVVSRSYRNLIQRKWPMRYHGPLIGYGREYLGFESIDCPYLNKDDVVEWVIGMVVRVETPIAW